MDRYSDVVQNENGRAVPDASIQIIGQDGTLATIYADRNGARLDNPLITDGLGRWSFCAADGVYTARVYLNGVLKATLPDIRLEDPDNGLSSLSAPTGAALVGTLTGNVQADLDALGSTLASLHNYTLPPATTTALGGVKIGSGLAIAGDGILSATGLVLGTVAKVNAITPDSGGNVTLTTDNLPEGANNQYFNATRVRNAVLSGLSTATNAVASATDTVLSAIGKLQAQVSANVTALATKQDTAGKDATGGYTGLTGFAINIKNATGTIVSGIASIATAARIYTFPDKDITVAGTTNEVHVKPTIKGYIEQMQALNPGATVTLDPLLGTLIELTTTANVTITLPAAVAGMGYTLMVKYGAAHTLAFAGGTALRWTNGNVVPTATSVTGKIDKYVFTCGTGYTIGQDGGRNA